VLSISGEPAALARLLAASPAQSRARVLALAQALGVDAFMRTGDTVLRPIADATIDELAGVVELVATLQRSAGPRARTAATH
jgi:hypothetical protein